MVPVFNPYRSAVLLSSLLLLTMGCVQSTLQGSTEQEYLGIGIVSGTLGEQQRVAYSSIQHPTEQEYLGMGIVSGTLGEQQRVAHSGIPHPIAQEYLGIGIVSGTLGEQQRLAQLAWEPSTTSVTGQVLALEGGAYVIRDHQGRDLRVPHDENTRIDRPAHVGDYIQCWLDHHGRAVRIRGLDGQ